jgi:hypothetical protein
MNTNDFPYHLRIKRAVPKAHVAAVRRQVSFGAI